ncbi:MAG TPA: hypothetical protein VL053_09480 [Arachidicoccus sp.]|nr:hypothetical protein [Arachidicoccus sp.]
MTIEEVENILLAISDKDNDEKSAVAGFTALYHSYGRFLNSVVSRVLKDIGIYDEHVLNTVVNNTFFKLYQKPLIFSFRKEATDDKGFKAWLSIVAKNDLKASLAEYYRGTLSLEIVNDEPVIESDELKEEIFVNVNLKVLDKALQLLSERDKYILLTLYLYYEEGKNTPSDVLKILCNMYDTTPVNIRKIRERAEKKIEEYFSKNSHLKPLKHVK